MFLEGSWLYKGGSGKEPPSWRVFREKGNQGGINYPFGVFRREREGTRIRGIS